MLYSILKRAFDFSFALLLIITLFPFIVAIYFAVVLSSSGGALYWSDRIGINNKIFKMPKFRTMKVGTPVVATHLLRKGQSHLTSIGGFLRKTSLDEIPQLISIMKGDMSFVGPRPALYNQYDLIELRGENGIHKIKPGLTGYAQIMGRDELSLVEKVKFDLLYLENKGLKFDLYIILKTVEKVLRGDGVRH
ncbi:sugar transferase [Halobacteriovorax marinus]|uniref:sugar transferase n=1 Tax=Halobacteriovorax marinus TaxID=97084 RepID=UPI003A91BCE0